MQTPYFSKLYSKVATKITSEDFYTRFLPKSWVGPEVYDRCCKNRENGLETFIPMTQPERNYVVRKVINDKWDFWERAAAEATEIASIVWPIAGIVAGGLFLSAKLVAEICPPLALMLGTGSFIVAAAGFYVPWGSIVAQHEVGSAKHVSNVAKKMLKENMRPECAVPGFFKARKAEKSVPAL